MSGTANYLVGVRIDGDASGLSRAAQEAMRQQRMLAGGSIREYQRMAEARAQLGVRSEREIQREMARTEAAYNRLARSGTMSWQEQRMAARAMRDEITGLNNEMGRLTKKQMAVRGLKGAAGVVAAATGAAMLIKPRLDRSMDYDTRLRQVANTGSGVGSDGAERKQMYNQASKAVIDSIRYGGGNRDDALETYARFVAKGSTFTGDLPQRLLPEVMRTATATGSSATDIGEIVAAGIQNFGMKRDPEDAKRWLNVSAIGSKLGGFETKDLAQYLPKQMALAHFIGMSGIKDYAKLVMVNEASAMTSGSPGQAATNVSQLIQDLNSNHFRRFVGQATGMNYDKYVVENRLRGKDAIDSSVELIGSVLQKHPAYQQLQAQYAKLPKGPEGDDERKHTVEAAMNMLQGSTVGKFFHNQESMQAMASILMNGDYIKQGQQQALSGKDEIGEAFKFISEGPEYQKNKMAIESAQAMQTAMDRLTPVIGATASGIAELMKQYPGYTTAILAATGAVTALAGAAGAASLFMGKGGPGLPGVGGPAAAAGAGRLGSLAFGGLRMLGSAGMAYAAGDLVGSMMYKYLLENNEGGNAIGRTSANVASFFGSDSAREAIEREGRFDKEWSNQTSARPRGAADEIPFFTAQPGSSGMPPGAGGMPMRAKYRSDEEWRAGNAAIMAGKAIGVGSVAPPASSVLALSLGTAGLMPGSVPGATFTSTKGPAADAMKGELKISISAAQGLNVNADAKSGPRLVLTTDMGTSMRGTGY